MSLFITEFTKIVRNDILHVQGTTHYAVIPFYKLTYRFISALPLIQENILG
jgi:hypothetical protein